LTGLDLYLTEPVDACPACGERDRTRLGPFANQAYVGCRSCRTLYVDPQPPSAWVLARADEFADALEAQTTAWSQDVTTEQWKLGVIEWETHRETGRILDVGAGSGSFVVAARAAGFDAIGHDISTRVADIASRQTGAPIHGGELGELDGGFHIVTLWDTLEHSLAPRTLLEHCRNKLLPGGHLIVASPHGRGLSRWLRGSKWWVMGPTDHFVMFSMDGLQQLFAAVGLREVQVFTRFLTPATPPGSGERSILDGPFAAAARSHKFLDALHRYHLGDTVIAVGRAPFH
jgi:SAM-dependent methyltransferase